MTTDFRSAISLGFALTMLAGCASGPPATATAASMAAASEAINHARSDNALASAPQIIADAQQRYNQAQTAANSGDNEAAIRLANEAKADADLADATAQATQSEQAAQTVNSDINTLKQTTAPK